MDSDIISQLMVAPSLRTFLDEVVILMGIILVNEVKKKFPIIAKSYFDGLHSILIVTMPSIAFFNVLTEIHLPIYHAVLSFILIFVGWFVVLCIKHKKIPTILIIMFISILVFIIIMFSFTYSFLH